MVELPESGQVRSCRISNEEEQRKKKNVISRVGKVIRNEFMMNIIKTFPFSFFWFRGIEATYLDCLLKCLPWYGKVRMAKIFEMWFSSCSYFLANWVNIGIWHCLDILLYIIYILESLNVRSMIQSWHLIMKNVMLGYRDYKLKEAKK